MWNTEMRRWVFALLLLLIGGSVSHAQMVNLQVCIENKLEKDEKNRISYEFVRFGYFNYTKASEIFQKLQSADPNTVGMTARKLGVSGITKADGTFSFECPEGFGIIIITGNSDMTLFKVENQTNHQDRNGHKVTAKKNKDGNYDVTVTISANRIAPVIKKGTLKGGGNTIVCFDFDDGFERFKTHLEILSDFDERNARLILQPYAIDCLTDDTVDYLLPFNYEGERYHVLQNRRKAFDFFHKDAVGKERTYMQELPVGGIEEDGDSLINTTGTTIVEVTDNGFKQYIEQMPRLGDTLVIDTIIIYKRPIRSRRYRGAFQYSLEDYHHRIWKKQEPGTCLRISPFKFLDFSVAISELKLTEDFHEVPLSNKDSVKQDLGLQFKYATAELVDDPNYGPMLDELAAKMSKYADDLTDVNLVAYASPDGNEAGNKALARRRAEAALARIKIPNRHRVRTHVDARIDTWDETARLLEKEGHTEESQAIIDALQKTNHNNSAAEAIIKRLPTYQEVVKPVLESQCRIVFTYEFFAMHKLSENEAYEAYLKDKKRNFSPGDYFNIFKRLTENGDSAEIDSLTLVAYDRIVKPDREAYKRPFASYLINRKAIVDIKRGVADSLTLKDLILERLNRINWVDNDVDGLGTAITFNRPEVLLNQAIIFYQMQNIGRAKWFVEFLKKHKYTDKNLEKLEHFINFKMLYPIPDDKKTEQQKIDFAKAKAFVENSGPDNKAILYTELEDLGMRDVAWQYVHKMNDENPKKWYLFGILWSLRDGSEDRYRPLPMEYMDMPNLQFIPYYLSYFQHAFDLDSDLARYYFNEGHISETMRKKKWHAYKTDRIPLYRQLFKVMKEEDDREKERLEGIERDIKEDEKKTPDAPVEQTTETTASQAEKAPVEQTTEQNEENE